MFSGPHCGTRTRQAGTGEASKGLGFGGCCRGWGRRESPGASGKTRVVFAADCQRGALNPVQSDSGATGFVTIHLAIHDGYNGELRQVRAETRPKAVPRTRQIIQTNNMLQEVKHKFIVLYNVFEILRNICGGDGSRKFSSGDDALPPPLFDITQWKVDMSRDGPGPGPGLGA